MPSVTRAAQTNRSDRREAAALTWMVERTGYQMVRNTDPAGGATIVGVMTDIIWSTLYRTPPDS
jgi:hypothetical protein